MVKARQEIEHTHAEFQNRDAGHFFILYYSGRGPNNWQISNDEILEEIREL